MTSPRCILEGHEPGVWVSGVGVYDDRQFLLCAHCGKTLAERPNGRALESMVSPEVQAP